MKLSFPKEITEVINTLTKEGFDAYVVGGCVRDLIIMQNYAEQFPRKSASNPRLSALVKDWDIATSAKPEEIQKLFPDSVYENEFGTVGVKTGSEDPRLAIVEITTFRKEDKYTDKRHPDKISFTENIKDDLARRDFTINAIAVKLGARGIEIQDPYGGQGDLENKIIRAVGEPKRRFEEDALRLVRAVRFSAQLGFAIDEKTSEAIRQEAASINAIAKERVRDELEKIIMSDRAGDGIRELEKLGLLAHIIPELSRGVGMEQNKHHIYDIFEHNVRSLEYAVLNNFPFYLRLAAILHDVGKADTRRWKSDPRGDKSKNGKKGDWTFYQHQYVGEKIAKEIIERLKFSSDIREKVPLLIREHMFVYDPDVVTERGVRRLIKRIGPENIDDLIKLREADRIGSGVPKAQPYRLRHLQAMIEKQKHAPLSAKMLEIDGEDIMKELGENPGPKIGAILDILLEEVIDEPDKNKKEILFRRIKELGKLSGDELVETANKAKDKTKDAQERIDKEIKKQFFVS